MYYRPDGVPLYLMKSGNEGHQPHLAKEYKIQEEAETDAFLIASKHPEYLGKLLAREYKQEGRYWRI
jgi:hypothetical protein